MENDQEQCMVILMRGDKNSLRTWEGVHGILGKQLLLEDISICWLY